MRRKRWRTGRRGWRFGTLRWWCGFAAGLLLAFVVRELLVMGQAPGESKGEWMAVESSPIEHEEASVSADPPEKSGTTGTPSPQTGQAGGDAEAGITKKPDDHSGSAKVKIPSEFEQIRVGVYLTEEKRTETLPIELYVRGVIAGEMPVDFQLEALKAQAIAARTYIYRRLESPDLSDMPPGSGKAEVTDTVQHQVYVPLGKLLTMWTGKTKEANLEKLNRAVEETAGQIVTYEGEPIQAAFFSTSNGFTENASDYWDIDVPYLRSVASPWDKSLSPKYKETVTMKLSEFAAKLGVKPSAARKMRVLETTAGNRVKTVAIGNATLSGREVREKLGLASSQFTWKIDGGDIVITTFGYGHGVGMSQWGADGMAEAGSTAEQILTHYYTGTNVQQASKLPNSL